MGLLIQRFPEAETERAYLRAERVERGFAIRALIVIAALTLLSYVGLNPMHFPSAGVVAYNMAAGTLIAAMAGLFALTRTRFYREAPWIDLPVFVGMAAAMIWLAVVLAGLHDYTDFPRM